MKKAHLSCVIGVCALFTACANDPSTARQAPVRHTFNRGGEGSDSQGVDANQRYHQAAGNSNNVGGGFGRQSPGGGAR